MTDTRTQSTRRQWLATAAAGLAGSAAAGRAEIASAQAQPPAPSPLPLTEFEPKSMLHVAMTTVQGARFPVIDFHTHVSRRRAAKPPVPPAELLKTMDAVNLRTMVNLTGGFGEDLSATIAAFDRAFPRRFVSMTEPAWARAAEPGYARWQADEIAKAKAAGAVGVKVLKTLGLYLRDGGPTGHAGESRRSALRSDVGGLRKLGMPVAIHVGDPEAFFLPIDRFNERFEELNAHPDWSFHGKDFPVVQGDPRRPATGCSRNTRTRPSWDCTSATGPRTCRRSARRSTAFATCTSRLAPASASSGGSRAPRQRFFDRYQDRILFGTDAIPLGVETPQQVFGEELYRIYYRFLETEDEYFDYAPAKLPPQGRWRIYGLGLRDGILRKVYNGNAQRVLGLKLV